MKRTALLTGAAGKIGRYVIGALSRRGFEVVATDITSHRVPLDVRFEHCDLTDAAAVDRLVALVKPDVVLFPALVPEVMLHRLSVRLAPERPGIGARQRFEPLQCLVQFNHPANDNDGGGLERFFIHSLFEFIQTGYHHTLVLGSALLYQRHWHICRQ